MRESILVSACLLGDCVRYDASVVRCNSRLLEKWRSEGRVRAFCPEIAGGLSVPRPPAEIIFKNDVSFDNVIKVITIHGQDVTKNFLCGAQKTLQIARNNDLKLAIFKDGSPSCGSSYIYDGTFSGKCKPGKGITTYLLEKNGIQVFSEREIQSITAYLS